MNIVKIYEMFPTNNDCIDHIEKVRWSGKPQCPYCKSIKSTPEKSKRRYHCNNCNTAFSVTVGTIFHHTHLPIQKWFLAISLILNAKKGIAARQLARDIHVNKDTAWRISMKIREAMGNKDQRNILSGIVEMDETYVGGKPRKGSDKSGKGHKRGRGTKKTPVVGMIERNGNVTAEVANNGLTAKRLNTLVRRNVNIKESTLITDEYKGYLGIKYFMPHLVINHSIQYVNGTIHTNSIESFWAILKRGIIGQFHKVSKKYLQNYLNEFCYRFNCRKLDEKENDDMFKLTLSRGLGVN